MSQDDRTSTSQPEDAASDDRAQLHQRITQLEAIALEYQQIQELLDYAAENHDLARYMGDIVLIVDPATRRILDANAQALSFLGFSLLDLKTQGIDDLEIPQEYTEASRVTFIETGIEIQLYDCRYRRHDGRDLPVRVRKRLTMRGEEEVLHVALEDLSLRYRVWYELQRREDADYRFREKLKILHEISLELADAASPDDLCRRSIELGIQRLGFDRLSIWFFDARQQVMVGTFGVDEHGQVRDERDARWSYVNTHAEEYVNGKTEPRIVHDNASLRDKTSATVGYGWHISVPLLDRGRFVGFMTADNLLHQQPMQSYEPELLRLFGVTIGHLLVRQREQETIRKLSNAVQASASMVVILDADGVVEFVNDSFSRVSGYAASDILGQPIATLWPDGTFERIWPVISTGSEWRGELSCPKSDGTVCETVVSVSPIRVGDDTIKNYVVVLEDITELKRARQRELQLQVELERSRILQAFITDVGHEFRTPLSIISTNSYLINATLENPQHHIRADQIEEQVDFLSRMVDNMLYAVQLSGDVALDLRATHLGYLVQHATEALLAQAMAKHMQWTLDLDMSLTVQADEGILTRAIREIIKNAIEFSHEKSAITIRLQRREDNAVLQIKDTGVGIAAESIGKIFDRFYRVDEARTTRGTGLGLFIARQIVEAHQGTIMVKSVVNQGSTFEIRLPLDKPTTAP